MNRILVICLLVISFQSHATLIDRGNGLIYDDTLNVTWMQDANYAFTSDYHGSNVWINDDPPADTPGFRVLPDGKMGIYSASLYVNRLDFQGYTDWRLPTVIDYGTPGCYFAPVDAGECGYNISTIDGYGNVLSELGFMFHNNLGNVSDKIGNQALTNSGPFMNIDTGIFSYFAHGGLSPGNSFGFNFGAGIQDLVSDNINGYVWAVRDGDVKSNPVPIAPTLSLIIIGVLGLLRYKKS